MSTNSVNPSFTLPWVLLLYGKYAKEDEVYQSSQNGLPKKRQHEMERTRFVNFNVCINIVIFRPITSKTE